MNNQKVFFPSNIKFLRERKKWSQETIAEKLGLTRSKLNALENGQTKAPQPEDLINFSNTFKISVDSLLKIDLSKLGELKIRDLEAGNDIYVQGGNLRVLAISVDKNKEENIEYVPIKAKAGYSSGYNDKEYIETLPKFSFPNLPKGKTFRMFPITGDSMLPIPDGSDILASYLQNWSDIKAKTLCIVILKNQQDVVFKQVTLQVEGLLLESLNKAYQPYVVPVSEVLELWQFYSYQTREIPTGQTDMEELKGMIRDLREEIRK